jgi:hypothetical protein
MRKNNGGEANLTRYVVRTYGNVTMKHPYTTNMCKKKNWKYFWSFIEMGK